MNKISAYYKNKTESGFHHEMILLNSFRVLFYLLFFSAGFTGGYSH